MVRRYSLSTFDCIGGVALNTKETLSEVLRSVLPITIVILILQFSMMGFTPETFVSFVFGVVITIVGFTLFLIGIDNSLLPLGEVIGKTLVSKSNLWFILAFGIAVGFAVTAAEPGVQVLSNQIDLVSNGSIDKNLLIAVIS